ncbi:unnamed protein product [Candidula unifasciata]|uniref:RNA-binding protein 48 n=1 Tax=Candidula unifasciata TaxID=100452 RepID=A0A8S3YX47_9EUPU|nr:unnamed protein product [Candidula unifasciata]
MASQIPTHHVKQNVCATRPPYRDGRQPKAVKVYTVNNESSYILIQGVPSVGATQELHKLCSNFGLVDKFNALDDYPSEDKYSEVYLVRYKKIQSARFAKRKLDDHSFFGGALHVCYAPEYESVAETREKLQERQRVVAAKIRQHESINAYKLHYLFNLAANAGRPPPLAAETQVSQWPTNVSLKNTSHHMPTAQEPKQLEGQHLHLESSVVHSTPGKFDFVPETSAEISSPANTGYVTPHIQPTFELPLPPVSSLIPQPHKNMARTTYEFSRVRSAHATLPVGFDARVNPPLNQFLQLENRVGTEVNKQASSESPSNTTVSNSGIVIKNYQPAKVPPRFVPRQALAASGERAKGETLTRKKTDKLDQDIRRNAFCLGETQGPAVVPQRKRPLPTAAQLSVNETIMEIRNKISRVITQNVKKQEDPARPNL